MCGCVSALAFGSLVSFFLRRVSEGKQKGGEDIRPYTSSLDFPTLLFFPFLLPLASVSASAYTFIHFHWASFYGYNRAYTISPPLFPSPSTRTPARVKFFHCRPKFFFSNLAFTNLYQTASAISPIESKGEKLLSSILSFKHHIIVKLGRYIKDLRRGSCK